MTDKHTTGDEMNKETKDFRGLSEAIDHAKLFGGRVAAHINSHEATWFSAGWLPTDIMAVSEGMGITTFGTWGSWQHDNA